MKMNNILKVVSFGCLSLYTTSLHSTHPDYFSIPGFESHPEYISYPGRIPLLYHSIRAANNGLRSGQITYQDALDRLPKDIKKKLDPDAIKTAFKRAYNRDATEDDIKKFQTQ